MISENVCHHAVVAYGYVREHVNMDHGVVQDVQYLSDRTALHATNSLAQVSLLNQIKCITNK